MLRILPSVAGYRNPGISGAVPQVVSDVIVGIQAIGLVDALVQQMGYSLVIFIARKLFQFHQFHAGNRFADFYVHPAFGLGDSRQNTVQIFARFLVYLANWLS